MAFHISATDEFVCKSEGKYVTRTEVNTFLMSTSQFIFSGLDFPLHMPSRQL